MAFIAAANHKIRNAMVRIRFENVPQNWLATNFHHWFGPHAAFFANASAVAARQNNCLHRWVMGKWGGE
jgi:hypothetical protein